MNLNKLTRTEKQDKVVHQLSLRNTRLRDEVVTHFTDNAGRAFSENELKQVVCSPCDRTTIYRTIKTLLQKKFIHKVVCENGVLKYALTPTEASTANHVHFECTTCEKVFCLKEYSLPLPRLPELFNAESFHMLIKGSCKECERCPSKNM